MRSAIGPLNAYDLLQGVLHFSGTACARRVQLEAAFKPHLGDLPYSREGLRQGRNRVAIALEQLPQDLVLRRLFVEATVAVEFADGPHNEDVMRTLESFEVSQLALEGYLPRIAAFLVSRGLSVTTPTVFLVDAVPEPFEGASVVNIDADDEDRFRIARGIYFTQSAMTPVFAEYTMAHELIHWALGVRSPERLATNFEEGVADLTSMFDYVRSVHGHDVALNVAKIHRLTSATGLVWEHYVDAMRSSLRTVVEFGPAALYSAINEGRDALARIKDERVPPGSRFAEATEFGSAGYDALLTFPRTQVVSAVAFEIALHVAPGATLAELGAQTALSADLVLDGISELEAGGYLQLRRDGLVVEYSALPEFLAARELRYDFR